MKKYLSKGICIIIIATMVVLSSCSNGSSGGSSNVSFKSKKVDCYECGGSGLCKYCEGAGYIVISRNFGTTTDCVSCYYGECRRCDGRGWLLK